MPRRAFTLIELLVVIAIIGLLGTIAVVSLNTSRMNARNAKRKADLVQLSKALELYYSDNNGYPVVPGGGDAGVWWGNCSTYGSKPNSGATAWIPGLTTATPPYIATLPVDPTSGTKNNGSTGCDNAHACYIYNSTGTDYKLMAFCTPEGTWTSADPFYDAYYNVGAGRQSAWSIASSGAVNWR